MNFKDSLGNVKQSVLSKIDTEKNKESLEKEIKQLVSSPKIDLDALKKCLDKCTEILTKGDEKKRQKFFSKCSEPFLDLIKWIDPNEPKTYVILADIYILTNISDGNDFKKNAKQVVDYIEKNNEWIRSFVSIIDKIKDVKSCIIAWLRIAGNISSIPHILSEIISRITDIYKIVKDDKTPDVNKPFIQILGNAFDWEDNLCLTEENVSIVINSIKMNYMDKMLKKYFLKIFITLSKNPNVYWNNLNYVIDTTCSFLLPVKSDSLENKKAFLSILINFIERLGAIEAKYATTIIRNLSETMGESEKDSEIQRDFCYVIGSLSAYDATVTQTLASNNMLKLIISYVTRPKPDNEVKMAAIFAISKLKLRKNEIKYLEEFQECVSVIGKIIEANNEFSGKRTKSKNNRTDGKNDEQYLVWCIKALSKLSVYKDLNDSIVSIEKNDLQHIYMISSNPEVSAACLSVFSHIYIENFYDAIMNKVITMFRESKSSLVHRKTFCFFISLVKNGQTSLLSRLFEEPFIFRDVIGHANDKKTGKSDYKFLSLAIKLFSNLWDYKCDDVIPNYYDIIIDIIKFELLSPPVNEKYDNLERLKKECFYFMKNIRASLESGIIRVEQVLCITDTLIEVLEQYCGFKHAKKREKEQILLGSINDIVSILKASCDTFDDDKKRKLFRLILKISIRYLDIETFRYNCHPTVCKIKIAFPKSGIPPVISELNEKVREKGDVITLLKNICENSAELVKDPESILNGLLIENILLVLISYGKNKDKDVIKSALEALVSLSTQKVERLTKHILELYALDIIISIIPMFKDDNSIREMFCVATLSLLSSKKMCTQERLNTVKFMLIKTLSMLPESSIKADVQKFMREKNVMCKVSKKNRNDMLTRCLNRRTCFFGGKMDNCDENVKKSQVIEAYEIIPSEYYEDLEETLKTAEFKYIKPLLKYSKEIAMYLERNGILEKCGMTMADAMAITIYTYDNGADEFEDNPYRIINKALSDRNTSNSQKLRGYILRLLSALRKITPYNEKKVLYRAVTNINKGNYKVGNKLTWPAFTSTSSDEDSVIDFFNNIAVKGDKYIFEITGFFDKGHNVKEFSFHSSEEEILFEPETQFEVKEIKPDPNINGVTRICVEVLDTPPILDEVVKNLRKKCEENADKESFIKESIKKGGHAAPYRGPIVPKEEWHDFWGNVEKSQTEYMCLKKALIPIAGKDTLREILVDGYKKAIIDDEYGEGADMMKGYELSVEEGASLYSYTYKYGEEEVEEGKNTPSNALSQMMGDWDGKEMEAHWANYLLHIASGLEKLPVWGKKVDADDDKVQKIYFCMKKEEADKLKAGKECVIGSIFVGCTEEPSQPEGECVVCIEDAQNLCAREIGPLSAWGKIGYVLGLPGAHFTVISTSDESIISVKALPLGDEEKDKYEKCVKKFTQSAPLPKGWSSDTDDDTGRIFYQNDDTDEAQWTRPVIEDPKFFTDFDPDSILNGPSQQQPDALQSLPPNWIERVDPKTGRKYYANTVTKVTQWDFPRDEPQTSITPTNSVPMNTYNNNYRQYSHSTIVSTTQPQKPFQSNSLFAPFNNSNQPMNQQCSFGFSQSLNQNKATDNLSKSWSQPTYQNGQYPPGNPAPHNSENQCISPRQTFPQQQQQFPFQSPRNSNTGSDQRQPTYSEAIHVKNNVDLNNYGSQSPHGQIGNPHHPVLPSQEEQPPSQ